MSDDAKRPVGADNDKIPDSDIQGVEAGKRNRASTEAGVMPPPAGEPVDPEDDPRTADRRRHMDGTRTR